MNLPKSYTLPTLLEELYEDLYSKHFKTHYAGKPTKRYKQILNELEYIRQNQDQAIKIFERVFYR